MAAMLIGRSAFLAWITHPNWAPYWRTVKCVWYIDSYGRLERVCSYLLRSMIRPFESAAWASGLEQLLTRQQMIRNPRTVLKPHRPFINRRYRFAQRSHVFFTHYKLLAGILRDEYRQDILDGKIIQLASCIGKDGHPYTLLLRRTSKFDREGELILSLAGGINEAILYCVVFTISVHAEQLCFDIGCLQGGAEERALENIKAATKALHGIRPKNLVMDGLYFLASRWGIHRLYGVDNVSRIFRSAHVYADYDAFWRELGGGPERHGFFVLPEFLPHHSASDVPSHKRSAYRKRELLRDRLRNDIGSHPLTV